MTTAERRVGRSASFRCTPLGWPCLGWLLTIVLMQPLATQQEPATFALPRAELRKIERVAMELANIGRGEEVAELRAFLAGAGCPPKALATLDRRVASAKVTARGVERKTARAAAQLRRTIAVLAGSLAECPDPERRRELAKLFLRIDAATPAAHRALGHREHAGGWISQAEFDLLERRGEIQAALQAVRRLAPEITVEESRHPLLLQVLGRPGQVYRANGIEIHTCWDPTKARRLVANLLRAVALSRFLIDGRAVALPHGVAHTSVLFTGKVPYEKALRADLANSMSTLSMEDAAKLASYYRKDGTLVNNRAHEGHALAGLFSHIAGVCNGQLYEQVELPTLIVGHANWVLMALAGAHLPGIRYSVAGGNVGTSASRHSEWQKMLQGAGLMGARSYLVAEARQQRDPSWSRSFKPQVGMIDGVDLLKATFVVEFLQQRGQLAPILSATRSAATKKVPEVIASLEQALGVGLAPFEDEWRAWLCGLDEHLAVLDRLGGSNDSPSAGDREVLAYLKRVREAALVHSWLRKTPGVRLDARLSAHALLHARYLEQYPDQAAKWPDAHEEFTDREGFTPEGSWSGNHSVIAPGVRNPTEALDKWMATYFHRLPLLDPGLLCVGWAQAGTTCVLDSGSVVRRVGLAYEVAWPPDGMRNVPLRFCPELPNPFPGEDQSKWGYPITLQIGPRADQPVPVIEMSLRRGSADGLLVDTLLTSPQEPGNSLLVPTRAWCLIPRLALSPKTTYHVRAELQGAELGLGGTVLKWSFRTASR